jgi:hypothetical protein
MEIVNVGTIPVDEAIEMLLDPDNLKGLIGWHGALCFALVREMMAPGFYGHLIDNVATIDSTTRDHVAFIVFYGRHSGITRRAGSEYHPYLARYEVQGFSVSNERDIHVESRLDPRFQLEFDSQLREQFRYSPSQVDRPTLSQRMGNASRYLMERYSVPEGALPCLLFVDASDPTKRVIVELSPRDPLQSLYNHALLPISQEFADLSGFWKRRDEIKRNQYRVERANADLCELSGKISECDERLNRATENATTGVERYSNELNQWKEIEVAIRGRYEDPLVVSKIEHHPVACRVTGKLRSYQYRLAEAKVIEDRLLLASQDVASSSPQLSLETAQMEKRLGRVRQSIESKSAHISSAVKEAIRFLENAISRSKSELDSATRDRKNLETRISEAKSFLRSHNSDTLVEDERLLADLELSLRTRGYGDDVLTDSSPAAFSVIKVLQERKRLGVDGRVSHYGGPNTMRILFLAANPSQTSPLDLEEELRSLEQELRAVRFRDSITLIARHAARPDDLVRHVREHKPNVIHFSGHGSTTGIILRDDTGGYQAVEGTNLRRFLEGRGVDLVVLNACYSKGQAATIHGAVRVVVGTIDAVGDEAARRFTVAFYRSLGNGLSVREAFRDGGDAVALHGLIDVFHSGGDLDLTFVSATDG